MILGAITPGVAVGSDWPAAGVSIPSFPQPDSTSVPTMRIDRTLKTLRPFITSVEDTTD